MTANPFSPQQLADICRFLQIIMENGGHGIVEIVVKGGEVKFINLKEVKRLVNDEA